MATGSRTKNRTSKAEQSRATRVKIVAAATDLFVRDGFVTTTMASIAKEAGVAVQTLYLSFGNKTAILQAAFDDALRGGVEEDIGEQDWYVQVLADPDGPAALSLFCTRTAAVMTRAAAVYDVMRSAAADPEVGEMLAHNKKLRHDGFRAVAAALASRKGFNDELSVDDAHGILYTVLSEDSCLLLVSEHGWTPRQWSDWALRTLSSQLFGSRLDTGRVTG
ncbi:MAG: TetR/AcrR family transcriptional regulator [Marmoricola sp.]